MSDAEPQVQQTEPLPADQVHSAAQHEIGNEQSADGAAPTNSFEDLTDVRAIPRVSIQAFCESDAVSSVIERASGDRRMAKAHVRLESGGIPAATAYYQTATTPNLIILESHLTGDELIGQLQGLAQVCDEGSNVLIIGHENDVQLYRNLISRGVAEYLVAPISMVELMNVINELFVNPDSEPLGNTMAFVGAKGGVGSSTIAHNVAFSISDRFQSDVLLVDMDLPFGTANIDFDQDPERGVADAVFSADRVDDTYLDRLMAKCTDHLSLLAAPSTLDNEYDFGPDDFRQVLDVAQRGTPNVVLDIPHLWTGWAKTVLTGADKVIITATPDLASLRNAKNLIDTLSELRPNDQKPTLVLNQVDVPKRPEISVADFADPLGIDPEIVIPFDPALFGMAANNGQMIVEADPKSEIAASFDILAQVLTGRREIQEQPKATSFFSMFRRNKK
ncbi:MAG: CtpF protein [Hyphomicrobiales bacterium]|nr:MAG: CtpF protein [Hyphomicrobiales bacterium]